MSEPAVATPTAPNPGEVAKVVPQSFEDKLKAAKENPEYKKLGQAESGVQPTQEVLLTEEKPAEVPVEAKVEEPTGDLETVRYGDKDVPLREVLQEAEFQVPYKGEMRSIEGIDKLVEMASIGYDAAQKNQTAKQAVLEAQKAIKEIEQNVEDRISKGVGEYLENLYDSVLKGVNPSTGQAFDNDDEKAGAVELVDRMKKSNQPIGKGKSESLTREDVEKLAEEKVRKIIEERDNRDKEGKQIAETAQVARETLEKIVNPFKQFFVKSDGKTLNTKVYNAYLADVQNDAHEAWKSNGSVRKLDVIKSFIEKAAKENLSVYKESLRGETKKQESSTAVPALKPSAGSSIPAGTQKAPAFGDIREAAEWVKAKFGGKIPS